MNYQKSSKLTKKHKNNRKVMKNKIKTNLNPLKMYVNQKTYQNKKNKNTKIQVCLV